MSEVPDGHLSFPTKVQIYYILCIVCNSAVRQSPLALCHIVQPYILGGTLLEWQLEMTCRESYTNPDFATVSYVVTWNVTQVSAAQLTP
jgi:hypothetical protein